MRIFITIVATATLAGCTSNVQQATLPPTATVKPPPTIVYAQGSTVYGDSNRNLSVTYTGSGGFELGARKADVWCEQHFGTIGSRLLSNDPSAGRAIFACE